MRALISLSGGLDSSTLLMQYKDEIKHCVFFNYGSKQNERELTGLRRMLRKYKKPLKVIHAKELFKDFDSALLAHSGEEVTEGPYSDMEVSNAKVPFRNGIFASVLVGLAETLRLDTILLAVHSGDHRLYPDCTPTFFEHFGAAVRVYSGGTIQVLTPFINLTKKDIAKLAYANGTPIDLTYSCYKGGDLHCGKCPTCIERHESLGENDPTYYLT